MSSIAPGTSEQIIAFADIQGYHRRICTPLQPAEIFDFLDRYYGVAQSVMEESDGKIIKFMGDSILILFPVTHPQQATDLLRKLKTKTDEFLAAAGYDSRLCVKAHLGTIASGKIGKGELERFDICGLAVNETALLPRGEWVLSDDLSRKLESL